MSRNGVIVVIAVIVLGVIGYMVVQENNEGPLEEMGESLDGAADDFSDSVEDAADELNEPNG